MFFIFGWGRQTVKKHGEVNNFQCGRCNNTRPWGLYTRRTWFTLFFIPVIPYSTEHFLMCPICGNGHNLDRQEFSDLLATRQNSNPAGQPGSTWSTNNYDPEFAGKTETQINYIKTMREYEAKKNAEK